MRNLRPLFIAAVTLNVLLAAGLGYLWWRWHSERAGKALSAQPTAAAGPPAEAAPPGNVGAVQSPVAPEQQAKLVPIQLSAQRLQSIGVKTGVVELRPVEDQVRTVGNVAVDERLLAYVQLRFAGWIQNVMLNSTYQYVQKGQPLFTIYSPDLVTTEQEYLIAEQNQRLLAASTVPGVSAGAVSLLESARERLRQWQVPEREIARLEATGKVQRELEIDSPVSGFVIERNALPNLYAQPETRLYTVADLSTVWVFAELYQDQIEGVASGDPAEVAVDTFPGRTFRGRVDFVYPDVDTATRTVRVRLVFPNPDLKLKPGMFVNVNVRKPMGTHLVVPSSGVLQSGTRQIVFVDHGGGYLEPRDVELGPQVADQYIVLKGLKGGERIVTSANFLIDSESQLQAALGSFVPPPPGAGAAAAMNLAQANIEFATSPSPPHKGQNSFLAKLTGRNSTPIPGAEMTVSFFMPAMPQMGMAAMRVVFALADKGGGNYEGQGTLPSGGTWQVTVVARHNGQVVATKQMSVNAEGGM